MMALCSLRHRRVPLVEGKPLQISRHGPAPCTPSDGRGSMAESRWMDTACRGRSEQTMTAQLLRRSLARPFLHAPSAQAQAQTQTPATAAEVAADAATMIRDTPGAVCAWIRGWGAAVVVRGWHMGGGG